MLRSAFGRHVSLLVLILALPASGQRTQQRGRVTLPGTGAPGQTVLDTKPVMAMEMHGGVTAIGWQSPSQPTPDKRIGTAFVLVNQGIFPDIQPAIGTYVNDLAHEGFATRVLLVNGTDPIGFRALLRAHYLKLFDERWAGEITSDAVINLGTGAVLIGDLPVPIIHGRRGDTGNGTPYEGNLVCDLYLTDMDGDWSYLDKDGIPFISSVDPQIIPVDSECLPGDMCHSKWPLAAKLGKGGARPEIFIGRIAPSPVARVNGVYDRAREVQLLNEYFARNHAYRHGYYPYVSGGAKPEDVAEKDRLAFYDDDWNGIASAVAQAHNNVWPGKIVADNVGAPVGQEVNRYISGIAVTNKDEYVEQISQGRWLWVEPLMHSSPLEHQFTHGPQIQSLTSTQVGQLNLNVLFFYLQGCDTSDYRQVNNLGDTYLFLGESLAVFGNTAAGPHDTGVTYASLKGGGTLGQAQMLSQCLYARTDFWPLTWPFSGQCDPKRYYCQTLLGDPTLRPKVFTPATGPVRLLPGPFTIAGGVPVPPVNLRELQVRTREQASRETPERLRRLTNLPPPGVDVLRVAPGQPVIDPEWLRSPNPNLRVRAEDFVRSAR